MAASIWIYFIPFYVLGALALLFGIFALLGRIRGGKYLKPIIAVLTKVPLFKKWLTKASQAALEKQNPELASAIKKLERSGVQRDPQRAQQAMSRLSASERRAFLEATQQQDAMPEPSNRAERRRLEKMRKQQQRPR
jgi:hypothetical protein